jgi:hypothetical protein
MKIKNKNTKYVRQKFKQIYFYNIWKHEYEIETNKVWCKIVP